MERYFIMSRDCLHCQKVKHVISKINMFLELKNKIKIIDISDEDSGMNNHITKMLKFEGTPCLYLDGVKREGAQSAAEYEEYIRTHLEMIGEI